MSSTQPDDVEQLRAELQRVQAELEHLQGGGHSTTRSVFGVVLSVLAVLAITLSLMSIWTFRTLNNTDLFVHRVGSIIDDPLVADAIADRAAAQLVQVLDLQDRIAEVLPDQASLLAAPITTAAQNYLEQAAREVVTSEQFRSAWDAALAGSHEIAISVLSGEDTQSVTTDNGAIVLNITPIVNTVLAQGAEFLSDLLGRPIPAPTVTEDNLNSAATALENALGIQLPDDFGTITLYQSEDLATAQQWYSKIKTAILLSPVAALVLLGLALVVSRRRLHTFLSIIVGVALLMVFVRLALSPLKSTLVSAVADQGLHGAVAAAFDTVTSSLLTAIGVATIVGVVAALLLFLTGRSRQAQASREMVAQAPNLAAQHRGPFLGGGAVVALILLVVIPGRSWGQLLLMLLLYAGYALAVLLAPRYTPAAPTAAAPTG